MGNRSVQRKCPQKQKTMKINSEMYSLQHFTKEQIRDFHEIKRVIMMAWICHLLPSTGILRKCQVSVPKIIIFSLTSRGREIKSGKK